LDGSKHVSNPMDTCLDLSRAVAMQSSSSKHDD
jgi:hypothetical protein